MLRINYKHQILNLCDSWSSSPNINLLSRMMIRSFKKAIEDTPHDANEILLRAFNRFKDFNDADYTGYTDQAPLWLPPLPKDHFRFAGLVFETIARSFLSSANIALLKNALISNDPDAQYRDAKENTFIALYPVMKNRIKTIVKEKEELEKDKQALKKAKQDTYLKCFTLLQGSRQPASQVPNVPSELMENHIFPMVLEENIAPELCAARSSSIVRFFNNHLSRKEENSPGLFNTIRRWFS